MYVNIIGDNGIIFSVSDTDPGIGSCVLLVSVIEATVCPSVSSPLFQSVDGSIDLYHLLVKFVQIFVVRRLVYDPWVFAYVLTVSVVGGDSVDEIT